MIIFYKENSLLLRSLDIKDTTLYKGLAILMIVTHNFMHLLPPSIGENEFNYVDGYFQEMLFQLGDTPLDFLRISLSYFGHLGVQVFIFLSAYGLSIKYMKDSNIFVFKPFIFSRLSRIYPTFILAILIWSIVGNINVSPLELAHGPFGWFDEIYLNWQSLLYKFLFISPFIPGEPLSLEGPWWFISFIFQFYLIFPLLLGIEKSYGGVGLCLLSVFGVIASYILVDYFAVYTTVLGHLPELALGIYCARVGQIKVSAFLVFSVAVIFLLSNINGLFWHLHHISALVLLLFSFQKIGDLVKKNRIVSQVILFVGGISLQLFLVNGFLRYPFLSMANKLDSWMYNIIFCIVSLIFGLIVAYFLHLFEKRLRAIATKKLL